ncbi:MAG: porin [Planctomycetota bacterium]|jgi:hypothetical protein
MTRRYFIFLLPLALVMMFIFAPPAKADEKSADDVPDETAAPREDFMPAPASEEGFTVASGDLTLKLGGRFVMEIMKYSHANPRDSGFEFDTARLSFEGSYRDFSWRVEPDLIGVDTRNNLYEALGTWDIHPAFRLTSGLMKVALSTEFATHDEAMPLIGYGFASYLDGRFDWGVRADGDLVEGTLWYEATATTGSGFDLEGERKDNSQYSLRVVLHPFSRYDFTGSFLKGLFVGAGLAYSPDHEDRIVVANPFESVVFVTEMDIPGEQSKWVHLELGYTRGPFRFVLERVRGSIDEVPISITQDLDMDQLTSWQVYGTWNITGFEPEWERGRWLSMREADRDEEKTRKGRYGRWELAARYSNADIDRNLFIHGYTNYTLSTQEVRTFSLNLHWYLDQFFHKRLKNMRMSLGWVKTIADHELRTFGGTNRDSSFVFQVALQF